MSSSIQQVFLKVVAQTRVGSDKRSTLQSMAQLAPPPPPPPPVETDDNEAAANIVIDKATCACCPDQTIRKSKFCGLHKRVNDCCVRCIAVVKKKKGEDCEGPRSGRTSSKIRPSTLSWFQISRRRTQRRSNIRSEAGPTSRAHRGSCE